MECNYHEICKLSCHLDDSTPVGGVNESMQHILEVQSTSLVPNFEFIQVKQDLTLGQLVTGRFPVE